MAEKDGTNLYVCFCRFCTFTFCREKLNGLYIQQEHVFNLSSNILTEFDVILTVHRR